MKTENQILKPTAGDAGDHWAERQDWLGRFPFPPGEKKCKIIRSADKLTFLQGEKIKCVVDLFVSSDVIHFGIFYVPPFDAIEASAPHPGDECYYVLAGEGSVLISDTDTYKVSKGDAFYLPAGLKHQWRNFGATKLDVLWAIAPRP